MTIFNDEAERFLGLSPDETIKLREELSGFEFEHFTNTQIKSVFDDHRVEH